MVSRYKRFFTVSYILYSYVKLHTYREEHADLFQSVRVVSNVLEKYYSADALNIAIQDGKDAGQSVPHVHVHILPRKSG